MPIVVWCVVYFMLEGDRTLCCTVGSASLATCALLRVVVIRGRRGIHLDDVKCWVILLLQYHRRFVVCRKRSCEALLCCCCCCCVVTVAVQSRHKPLPPPVPGACRQEQHGEQRHQAHGEEERHKLGMVVKELFEVTARVACGSGGDAGGLDVNVDLAKGTLVVTMTSCGPLSVWHVSVRRSAYDVV